MSSWIFTFVLAAFAMDRASPNHIHHHKSSHCYAEEKNPYLYFASKTAYNAVYKPNEQNIIPSECTPAQLWMLVRHGTRYPLLKKMKGFQELDKVRDEIVKNHVHKHRGKLCGEDLENLKNWKMKDVPLSESDHLTEEGFQDLRDIGNRTRARFHNLFNKPYSINNYKLQYTKHSKTKHSAEAFAHGLFRNHVDILEPKDDDLLPQIYPECKVAPLPGADDPYQGGKNERNLFKDGILVEEVVYNVSKRLGFLKDNELTIDDIEQMYDICRYEKSWHFTKLSPWCAIFTKYELQILEYIGDLSYYYNSGHGYSANLRTGCPLVKDMMDRFSDLAKYENNEPNAVVYFGHSTTMYNLFARLGVARDAEAITHDNYYHLLKSRKWHTSLLAPFSGNFAAVFLRCSGIITNRVVFYHNEAPFMFPGCNGYVCDWAEIESKYAKIVDPAVCNFDFCQKNTTEATKEKMSDNRPHTESIDHDSHANIDTTDARSRVESQIPPGRGDNEIKEQYNVKNNNLDTEIFEGTRKNTTNHSPGYPFDHQNRIDPMKRDSFLKERNYNSNPTREQERSGMFHPKTRAGPFMFYIALLVTVSIVLYVIFKRFKKTRANDIKFTKLNIEYTSKPCDSQFHVHHEQLY